MNTKRFALFGLIFVIFLGVTGCAGNGIEAGFETETVASTAVLTAEPTATNTPDPTPTASPEPTSTPTFEEALDVDELSEAGEDIEELVTVLQEAGEEVTFKASDCEDMDEPYLVLTEGENCKALSEFMVEDLRIYETTKLLLIFDDEVSLDELHNPLLLQEGKIGDYAFYIVDVSELKYINDDYVSFAPAPFVRYHDTVGFLEEELRKSFVNPGKTKLAEDLAHNLFLGCSVIGDSRYLEVFYEAQNRDNFGELSFVKSYYSFVEDGKLKLECDPEQTALTNLIGAVPVSASFDSEIESSSLTISVDSIKPIPTQEPPPFSEGEGNETWDNFVEISLRVQKTTGLSLRASFDQCQYPNTPWSELVVYQNGNVCWKIDSIKSYGAEDANPETEQMDYYAGLVIVRQKVQYLDESTGAELDCIEWEELDPLPDRFYGMCFGRYARLDMYIPLPEHRVMSDSWPEPSAVPESAIGFDRESIEAFHNLDAWNGREVPFTPDFDKLGIIGVDRETYLFLGTWLTSEEVYIQPFELEVKEIQ